MKTNKLFLLFLFIIMSCSDTKEFDQKYELDLKKVELYLNDSNGEGDLPPQVYFRFELKNNSNKRIFFSSKKSSFDKNTYSRLYLLDTLKKKILNIYSGSMPFIDKNTSDSINGEISFRDHKDYFNLEDTFLEFYPDLQQHAANTRAQFDQIPDA